MRQAEITEDKRETMRGVETEKEEGGRGDCRQEAEEKSHMEHTERRNTGRG